MVILRSVREARAQTGEWRRAGLRVGLVPTMGFLHEGHRSLIERAARENDRVVVSIFVNPTQFGPGEDYERYPRDLDADAALCGSAGAHMIFHPDAAELYPQGHCTFIDMNALTGSLCGKSRPGHFRGVCTVVGKLFHIIQADRAYFGQKDAQQLAVIRRMVRDLDLDVEIIGCPLVRERDGLAKSSRNTYLRPEEREAARILSKAVFLGEDLVRSGERNAGRIVAEMTELIRTEPLARIDYVEAVDAETMEEIAVLRGSILVALAVFIGKTRLIDNFFYDVEAPQGRSSCEHYSPEK